MSEFTMIRYLEDKIEDSTVEFTTLERVPKNATPTGRVLNGCQEFLIGTDLLINQFFSKI